MAIQKIYGQWVDLDQREVYPAEVVVDGETGRISTLTPIAEEDLPEGSEGYLMPGFVDAHVHVESSMLVPSEFSTVIVTELPLSRVPVTLVSVRHLIPALR